MKTLIKTMLPALCLAALVTTARSEEIVVSSYGAAAAGFPYAIAMEKGFFKEAGANVTGILTSGGGGTTLRNMLGGGLAFADVGLSSVVPAVQQGADIKIIAATTNSLAEFYWATKKDSPINSMKDLRGKKLGYTSPRSTTQAADLLLLEAAGLTTNDVELVKTGGLGEGIAALNLGLIDAMPILDPSWSEFRSKYKLIAAAQDFIPPMTTNVAVASSKAIATRAEFIAAILNGRRKAVEFMSSNLDESAAIIAKTHNISVQVAKDALTNLLESEKKVKVPYFETTRIRLDAMNAMIRAQIMVGAIDKAPDWNTIIDSRFLSANSKEGGKF